MPPTKFAQRLAAPFKVMVTSSIHSGTSHQTAPNNHPTAFIAAPQSSISFIVTGSIVTIIIWADIASAATSHSTERQEKTEPMVDSNSQDDFSITMAVTEQGGKTRCPFHSSSLIRSVTVSGWSLLLAA